jgi:hypothetical protein
MIGEQKFQSLVVELMIALRLSLRNLGAFLSCFGESDGDCLLSARYLSALAPFARSQCSALFPMHGTLYAFACRLSVSRHHTPPWIDVFR